MRSDQFAGWLLTHSLGGLKNLKAKNLVQSSLRLLILSATLQKQMKIFPGENDFKFLQLSSNENEQLTVKKLQNTKEIRHNDWEADNVGYWK